MNSPVHRRIAQTLLLMERNGQPGFVPDLVQELGYAGESSLTATLRLMERDGLIAIRGGGAKGRSRMVTLTSQGRFALGAGGLPVLGSIPAGPLAEAIADPDEILEPKEFLPWREGDFLLRVKGDSMTGDGIFDRDLVLIRPEVELHQGEIAAVLLGEAHETTLKHVFQKGDKVILHASNPEYSDLAVPAQTVKIAGAYRGLVRHAGGRP